MEEKDIEDIDRDDMKSVLEDFPGQIKHALDFGNSVKVTEKIDKILICGMGGSALPGFMLQSFMYGHRISVEVVRDYFLPEYVNSKTLAFVISYSGNTEEAVYMYRNALRKNCKIVVITSGGKLAQLAEKQNVDLIKIPKGIQPRQAFGYLFIPILNVLQNSRLIRNVNNDVEQASESLKNPKLKELAEDLADKLVGKIPLIYSSARLHIFSYKWKISFNENTKIHAFSNVFSEFNHNEIVGYTDLKADYYCIMLRDEDDHKRIRDRFTITKKLIKKKGVPVTEVSITGSNFLTKMFTAMHLADLTSFNLAIKYETDPSPVDIIENLKKDLGKI